MKFYLPIIFLLTLFSCEEANELKDESKNDSVVQKDKIFEGSSFGGNQSYDCSLKIKSDSSIVLVGNTRDLSVYFEETGTIEQVKDSIYLITSMENFFAGPMEDDDFTDKLLVTSDRAMNIKAVSIIYSNGTKQKIAFDGPDSRIPFDPSLFSETIEKLGLDIGHINPITKKKVIFNAFYGSGYELSNTPYKGSYFVIIKGNQLRTINTAPTQCGHMSLNYKTM